MADKNLTLAHATSATARQLAVLPLFGGRPLAARPYPAPAAPLCSGAKLRPIAGRTTRAAAAVGGDWMSAAAGVDHHGVTGVLSVEGTSAVIAFDKHHPGYRVLRPPV